MRFVDIKVSRFEGFAILVYPITYTVRFLMPVAAFIAIALGFSIDPFAGFSFAVLMALSELLCHTAVSAMVNVGKDINGKE